MCDAMADYWSKKVLPKAKVSVNPETGRHFSLKTCRGLKATQWCELYYEYKVMKWVPAPPNPL